MAYKPVNALMVKYIYFCYHITMTASQMRPSKIISGAPKVLLIIATLGIVSGFFSLITSKDAAIQITSIIDIILMVGLLLRKEIARKIAIVLLSLGILLFITAAIYYAYITNIVIRPLKPATLSRISHDLYLTLFIQIIIGAGILFYLTRPKVKQAFSR